MDLTINLTAAELADIDRIALDLYERRKHQKHHGPPRTPEQLIAFNKLGMMGEVALSKHLGIPYSSLTVYDPSVPDVGECQVKTTRPGWDLKVKAVDRNHHPPTRPYVLAWAMIGQRQVTLVGWETLGNVIREELWHPELDLYLKPHDTLRDMADL